MSDPGPEIDEIVGDISEPAQEFVFTQESPFMDVQYDDVLDQPAGSVEDSSNETIGDGSCLVCGAPTFRPPGLTKAGHKKRTPKYCDLHAPNSRVSSTGPSLKGVETQLANIQEELRDDVLLLATMAGPILPVTSMYVFDQADAFTKAIIKLAQGNKTALRILHRAAQVAPIYTVAETFAGTAYAVQVDTKGADPHNVVGRRLKVAQAYDAVYAPDTPREQAPTFEAPPRYNGSVAGVQ